MVYDKDFSTDATKCANFGEGLIKVWGGTLTECIAYGKYVSTEADECPIVLKT